MTTPSAGTTGTSTSTAGATGAPKAGSGTAGGKAPTATAPGTAGKAAPTTGAAAGMGAAGGGTTEPAMGAAGSGTPTTTTPAVSGGSVLEFHGNPTRDGHYIDAAFTRAAAAMIHRDMGFTAMMSGPTYAQPLYFEGGAGGKDIVIVATETNEVSAFDAMTGAMAWRTMLAPAGPQGGGPGGCSLGNISPLGVTGTPVIDATSKTMFVAAMTTGGKHNIFALNLEDGKVKDGWPVDVSTVKAGSQSFNSPAEHQRGALTIVNGIVYVPYGGHYGDCGDYRGWVVGVPVNDPKAPLAWATRGSAGGVWAPSGVASDGTSVFVATGNTMAAPSGAFPMFSSPSMWSDGEAILRLPPDLNFDPSKNTDFFTPMNWAMLDQTDLDVGGSGVILFDAPGATPSKLAIALGKDGSAFLASQENLGGMGGQVGQPVKVSGEQIMQSAAAYTTPSGTFVAMRARGQGCKSGSGAITALKVAGSPAAVSVDWCGGSGSSTGSPVVTTTDGMTDSIVWYVGGGKLIGLDGEKGTEVVSVDGVGMSNKWQTPIVAKGRIYFAASNQLYAFAL